VEHQAFGERVLFDHPGIEGYVLPLAARIGKTQVDVFDVVVLHMLQDVFGGLHENPSWLQVLATGLGYRSCNPAAAEPRGNCSIASGRAQHNKQRRRNRHLLALSAASYSSV